MQLLDAIQKGKKTGPRRIMLYGTHGIGKSTFGAMSPKPIFIQTEDGLDDIDCHSFPLSVRFESIIEDLVALHTENHEYKTVVVDSLDFLERMIWKKVCADRNKKNIEEIGYAKGYTFALDYWTEFLDRLNWLRKDKGMSCILIAHAKIEKFENPDTDTYDRYSPRLHKHAAALIQEWCDEVLFASYKVYTRTTDEGFDKAKAHGVGEGKRIIRTTEKPSHLAKNRIGLPEEMELDWREFEKHLTRNGG